VVELVTAQASSNPFAVAVACHPAMVDPSGADKIGVPYALVASMEEAPETIKDFESRLKVPHRVETFGDQVHGFMAARADLSDPHVKAEYARGYQIVLEFLGKHWI
jgi:dienelactone hydrolase